MLSIRDGDESLRGGRFCDDAGYWWSYWLSRSCTWIGESANGGKSYLTRPCVRWRCHRVVQAHRSGMHRHWLVAWVGRLIPVGSDWLPGCVHHRGNRSDGWKTRRKSLLLTENPHHESKILVNHNCVPPWPWWRCFLHFLYSRQQGATKQTIRPTPMRMGTTAPRMLAIIMITLVLFSKRGLLIKTNREGNLKTLQRKGVNLFIWCLKAYQSGQSSCAFSLNFKKL